MNNAFVDRFSIVHAAVGAIAALSQIPAPLAFGGAVAFEVVENGIKRRVDHIWPDPTPDGLPNAVGDVVTFAMGYYGARLIRNAPGGGAAIIALAALGAAIWTASLLPRATPAAPRFVSQLRATSPQLRATSPQLRATPAAPRFAYNER